MKLTVNSKETEVKDGCTIAELSTFLALPEKGIAIAVNNRMVPRIEWEKCVLHPNDSLVVIKGMWRIRPWNFNSSLTSPTHIPIMIPHAWPWKAVAAGSSYA